MSATIIDRELEAKHRAVWALGDYASVADDLVSPLGSELVAAAGIRAGQRVLDVAAGTGNAAFAAAQTGARVIASDLCPDLLERGRAAATAGGLDVDWREANAEALPYTDGEFDAVISCIGVMFAPHHQQAADELIRVCRPGGILGMAWHRPDRSVPWVVELDRIAERTDMGKGGEPLAVAGFDPFQEREFAYRHTVSVDTLVATVASWSHVAISPRREKILADVRALGETVAGSTAAGTVDFPYVTEAVRARRS